jgi:hypothetical protein
MFLAAGVLAVLMTADDAETAAALRPKGATVQLKDEVAVSLNAPDCSKWTDEEYRQVGSLKGLRTLSIGHGLTDATLALLGGLAELESLQTNESRMTDEGVKLLLPLRKLKILKLFHPGKEFTGTGLAVLADLPVLDRLTVAGSATFADAGMAAVGTLPRLVEFRTWHVGHTIEGVKALKTLKTLKSLTIGQRLAYAPPTSLADDTLAALAELTSLESLRLEEARLSREAVARLKALPSLKKLQLEGIDLAPGELEGVRSDLAGIEVGWTAPTEAYRKRIDRLFGPR